MEITIPHHQYRIQWEKVAIKGRSQAATLLNGLNFFFSPHVSVSYDVNIVVVVVISQMMLVGAGVTINVGVTLINMF